MVTFTPCHSEDLSERIPILNQVQNDVFIIFTPGSLCKIEDDVINHRHSGPDQKSTKYKRLVYK